MLLLPEDGFKDIVVGSLQFLVKDGRIKLYGFVIMPNHIHLVWQVQDEDKRAGVLQSFLKYTAQQMKFELMKTNPAQLEKYKVKASYRAYQFSERKPVSVDLWSSSVFLQVETM